MRESIQKFYNACLLLYIRSFHFLLLKRLVGKKNYQSLFGKLHMQGLNGLNYGRHAGVIESGEKKFLELVSEYDLFDKFIDGGGHTGEYTDLILNTFHKPTIYIFEPSLACIQVLNEKYKNYPNVSIIQKGLSSSDESLYLKNDGSKIAELTREYLPGAHSIETTRIDSFCAQHKINQIDFIKLDIEGYEFKVISTHIDSFTRLGVKIIQFEISSGILRSELNYHLNDIVNLLIDKYFIGRILIDGITPIQERIDIREIYLGANYVAVRRDLISLWNGLT